MKILPILLVLTAAPLLHLFADMGSIPFKKGAHITEPQQNAIIAWNGREQLLYLQTTLAAAEETKVLEVMPLPSKPSVEASTIGVFQRCAFLLPRPEPRPETGSSHFGSREEEPAAKVVERKLLGAHDIRIVELLDAQRFAEWVEKEFQHEGHSLSIPAPLLAVIDEYAKDGFQWFLFDVVDLKKELVKKTPLKIRFATDFLFYPMRITRTEKGRTTVTLSILSNVLFNDADCVGLSRSEIEVEAKPREIPGSKVKWIDPPIFELRGRPAFAKIRSWKISGEIDSFQKDLVIRNPVN